MRIGRKIDNKMLVWTARTTSEIGRQCYFVGIFGWPAWLQNCTTASFFLSCSNYGYTPKTLPTPFFNVINGGAHADSGLDIQEFFIIPLKGSFATKLRMGAEVFHQLKSQLAKQGLTVAVGDEGGFAPKLIGGNETALKQLTQAIKSAKYILGRDFALGMDAAASV